MFDQCPAGRLCFVGSGELIFVKPGVESDVRAGPFGSERAWAIEIPPLSYGQAPDPPPPVLGS